LPQELSLEGLNKRLQDWIETDYHQRRHGSTGQSPLERYLAHLALLRPAPKDLLEYFRIAVPRKVDKDRTVSLNGKLYEAPPGLAGKQVMLLYHEYDPQRIEVLSEEHSRGFLLPLNLAANSRVRRSASRQIEVERAVDPASPPSYRSGSLFDERTGS
jgi:putative transposase